METRKKNFEAKVNLSSKKKLKKNELQIKRTGLQVKIMKDEREKKFRDWSWKETRNENFISVAKKISWVPWPLRAIVIMMEVGSPC